MIALSQLATDRLIVGLIVGSVLLLWALRKALRLQPPQSPVAGRRSHAVTVRGVKPTLRMRGHLTPAQKAVVRRLLEESR